MPRLRARVWIACALALLVLLLLLLVAGTQGGKVTPDQWVAADFLGVPPSALSRAAPAPEGNSLPWGVCRSNVWRCEGREGAGQPRASVLIAVDLDLLYVDRAFWRFKAGAQALDAREVVVDGATGAVIDQ